MQHIIKDTNRRRRGRVTAIAGALFACSLALPLAACEDDGPAEEAEDAVEETGEEIEDTAEDIGDDLEDVGDG